MAFDKNKVMRAAECFLAQGRISSAIAEYRTVVENDSSDINTQNMLGDLYLKSDDKKSAIKCYTEVAEHYNSHGYEKKAIAIYNKLHRLEPDSAEVAIKLAELYQVRGSHSEAEKHYEQVSNYYEKRGNKAEALTIWEKIAEISPRNTQIYLKIGNFYWQNNQKEEAARAFTEGGLRLAENGKHEEAVAAFSRSFQVAPDDLAAVRGFVTSQIRLGYPEEAIKMLDELYERDSYNADVVFLLADCYLDMEQPERAEIIIVELVTREPKAYAKLLHLVDFYMKKNDLDSSIRILSTIAEQLLVSQKPERLLDILNEIVARNPEQLQALRLLIRYYSWHKNDYELKKVLEQLAEAANYNKSIGDEKFALTQLLVISPEEPKYSARLGEINEAPAADESDPPVAAASAVESDKKIPTFESYDGLLNGDECGSIPDVEIAVGDESEEIEIELTEADLHAEDERVVTDVVLNESESEQVLDIDEQTANLNFYIEQGYVEIALDTLKELDDRFGRREEFEEIRETLERMNEAVASSGEETLNENDKSLGLEVLAEEEAPAETALNAEDLKSDVLLKEGDESEDRSSALSEEAEDIAAGQPETEEKIAQDISQADENNDDKLIETVEVRESERLTERSEESSLNEDAGEKEEVTTPPVEPETGSDQSERQAESLKPVENAISASDEKYETHYHHAVAYQEMGLIEDAIREFQGAVECVDSTNFSGRFFQCCTLLGHCFIEKGSTSDAIHWFKKALGSESLGESEAMALNYELGITYSLAEQYQEALRLLEKVYGEDPEYRNVEKRLEECREKAALVAA